MLNARQKQMWGFFVSLRMTSVTRGELLLAVKRYSPDGMLLEEGEQGEEEEPEDAHGVPVPGYAVDENLTGFQ
jgi:hypothetical protein